MSPKEATAGGGEGSSRRPEGSGDGESELAGALARRRLYREVTLALRTGLRDAKADFSFLRARGLRSLLGFLRSTASADGDSQLLLFRHSQSIPDLQVIPVLFQNSLHQAKEDPVVTLDHIVGVQPMKITSPPTDSEIALALRVLEGCCLLYSRCTALAHKYKAVKVLLNILASRGPTEQGVCLDALISLLLDSPSNQIDFEEYSGLEKVAELLKDLQVEEHIRLKCGEFLLLLIGHVYVKENTPIHAQMKNLFGEQCASLIWAASRFGSNLDSEQRHRTLEIQARRVVESLEPY
ncbi:uncharacterized protein LOC100825438 [Brachypodium distachyon]|uniref:Uncharacterized protein n=1 Tax=Brachypodium distachyon TaxID=15368 RepID=I1H165_BRADI|nr:uncharacterized protein LOC100825438 [Brachypodium distachyon]KQK19673.1 hypothetical protein BRADI_1g49740v3 [Brachypodium distachyon]|eukprot:XP_003557117.1 uncharacterized protein LOC100825438 [Brachypodium distachyon]